MESCFEHDGTCAFVGLGASCDHDFRFPYEYGMQLQNSPKAGWSAGVRGRLVNIRHVDEIDLPLRCNDLIKALGSGEICTLELGKSRRDDVFGKGQSYGNSYQNDKLHHYIIIKMDYHCLVGDGWIDAGPTL